MKNLSTIVKLATLCLVGGGTIGAAVGISEAQNYSSEIRSDEIAQAEAVDTSMGYFKNGEMILFQANGAWGTADAGTKATFMSNDYSTKTTVEMIRSTSANDKNLYYCNVPGGGEYNSIDFERWSGDFSDNWNAKMYLDHRNHHGSNFFVLADNWSYENMKWDSNMYQEFVYSKDYIIPSTKKTVKNKTNYVDIIVNRQLNGQQDKDEWFLKVTKNGDEKLFKNIGYLNFVNATFNDSLVHFSVPKDFAANSKLDLVSYKYSHSYSFTDCYSDWNVFTINDGTKHPEIKLDSNTSGKILYIEKDKDNSLYIEPKAMKSDHYPSIDVTKTILAGIDSCCDDWFNGYKSFLNWDKTLNISANISSIYNEKVEDFNNKGTAGINTNMTYGLKYDFLVKQNEKKTNNISLANDSNFGDNQAVVITTSVLSGVSLLAISGYVLFSKKKRKSI